MEISYYTYDHPEAGGRQAQPGETGYKLRFTLVDGRILAVHIGPKGYEALSQMLLDMMAGTPPYNDGTLPPE